MAVEDLKMILLNTNGIHTDLFAAHSMFQIVGICYN